MSLKNISVGEFADGNASVFTQLNVEMDHLKAFPRKRNGIKKTLMFRNFEINSNEK